MTAADKIAKARALIEPLMDFTPSPWELVSISGYGSPFSIRMAYHSDNPNAPKTHYGVQSVRTREDARLIAAAPALRDTVAALADLADALAQENARLLAENERMRKMRFNCTCPDPDECGCDNDMIVTEHASEAEARAALQADEGAQ